MQYYRIDSKEIHWIWYKVGYLSFFQYELNPLFQLINRRYKKIQFLLPIFYFLNSPLTSKIKSWTMWLLINPSFEIVQINWEFYQMKNYRKNKQIVLSNTNWLGIKKIHSPFHGILYSFRRVEDDFHFNKCYIQCV